MKYKIEELEKSRKQMRCDLIALYLECNDIDEFKVKQELELPNVSRNDVWACKLHYFRKMHPVSWRTLVIAYNMCFFASCIAFLLLRPCYLTLVCGSLLVLFAFVGIYFITKFNCIMASLELSEKNERCR